MTASKKSFHFGLQRLSRRLGRGTLAVTAAVLLAVSIPLSADVGQQEISLPEISDISCQSYIVYDRTTGETVISQSADLRIYPASMTKIMTAALALDNLTTDQILTVSQTAMDATTPNSTLMGLVVGEEISVSEILYGLLLPSGNDAANVLAEAIVTATGYTDPSAAQNTDAPRSKLSLFSDIMNLKAAELGLSSTHFVNANGLHDENHYTTASDLAMIFDYALGHKDFRTVIAAPTHIFKATNKHNFDGWKIVKNTNCLLTDPWILGSDTAVVKVEGGKTGTTIPGGTGMTLLSINRNGDELISIVCGIPYEIANRQTTYMASILNAGAAACFEKDPVVRVDGNVMDNKPFNAAAGLGPSGVQAAVPTESPISTPVPTVVSSDNITPAAAADAENDKSDSGFSPLNLVKAHPVISIIAGSILFIVILLVVVYLVANRKQKRSSSGIRRI